jgi:hypothetical protein
MDPVIVLFGGLVLFLFAFAVLLGLAHPKSGRQIVGGSLRDEGAEAEIEEHDIEQMIAARNEIRRRRGLPTIGEELAEELRRSLRDGPG